MLRFCVNISTMFTELPLLERFSAARAAGFPAVEMQVPFEASAEDLARAKEKNGLGFVLLSFPSGDRDKGDRGLGALPDRVDELRASFDATRRYAARLGATCVNLLSGCPGPGVERARARATLVENFRRAARAVRDIGAQVILEPINDRDIPGFFVSRVDDAISILDDVGEPNVGLQFDFYHVERMGDPLIPTFERALPRIAHVQFSDCPGRQEPGTGRIDFPDVFAAIERSAYRGWTGAEYFPKRPTPETLGWFANYRQP
jgi:hydroxypyruvate isomerase